MQPELQTLALLHDPHELSRLHEGRHARRRASRAYPAERHDVELALIEVPLIDRRDFQLRRVADWLHLPRDVNDAIVIEIEADDRLV